MGLHYQTVATDDFELLTTWRDERSQAAFEQIVRRHVALVLGVCRRELLDSHAAEDATQAVFVILSKKAGSIRAGTVLEGWLFNTARNVCSNIRRKERARLRHERAAGLQRAAVKSQPRSDHAEVAVDRALGRLREADRNALLLRFGEGRSVREVGDALFVTEEAAKKRIARGLQRLRKLLIGEADAGLSIAAVAQLLSRPAVAEPPGLVQLTLQAVAGSTGPATQLANEVIHMLLLKKLVSTAVGSVAVLAIAGGAWAAYDLNRPAPVRHSAGVIAMTNAAPTDAPDDARLHRALPQMNFQGVGLTDTVQFLNDVSGVRVSGDWNAIKAAGISVNTPIQLQLGHMTLTQVLREVLWNAAPPGKLDYVIDANGITISTAEALGLQTRASDPQENAAARAQLAKSIPAPTLNGQPMTQVSAALHDAVGVRAWIDWAALKQAGISRDALVKVSHTGAAPAGDLLKDALASSASKTPLAYNVIDGLVVVSTTDDLKKLQKLAAVSHVRKT